MKESQRIKQGPPKGLAYRARLVCVKAQRAFYAPKQLSACDLGEEFSAAQAGYILNYSNNVVKLTRCGQSYYFKQARERVKLREYILESVRVFFLEVCADAGYEREILNSLKDSGNFKKLVRMGDKDVKNSPLNIYLEQGCAGVLGLPECAEGKKALERRFVFYIYGELNNYFYNAGVKRGKKQTFLAVRTMAVKKLADMLGIGRLVPESRYVKLRFCGAEKYGTLESAAAGENIARVPPEERKKHITPALLCDLTSLNVLDALSGDGDHRVNNFNTVVGAAGEYMGVVSYDNDGPDAFFPSARLKYGGATGCSELVAGGRFNRPHLDKTLAERILGLDRRSVKDFSAYLTYAQRACLWARIKRLKRAVLKTVGENKDFLRSGGSWTEEDILEDISGRYGKTYLCSFLADCYYPGGLHPFDIC